MIKEIKKGIFHYSFPNEIVRQVFLKTNIIFKVFEYGYKSDQNQIYVCFEQQQNLL